MRFLSPLLAGSAALFAAACQQKSESTFATNLPETTAVPPAATSAQLPTVDKPLTRRDLLLASVEAASATASGIDDGDQQRALDGRPFSFRIRWCEGDRAFQQSFDPAKRVTKVAISPDLDRSSLPLVGLGADEDEAVGFWLPRNWLLSAGCPARPQLPSPPHNAAAAGTPPTGDSKASASSAAAKTAPADDASSPPATSKGPVFARTVGIVEWFRADDPRVGRNHRRSFAITRRLGEDEQPGPVDLVIEGRLSALPNGKVIQCVSPQPDEPPSCVFSVSMDQVRLEGVQGRLLAQWSNS